MTTEERLEKVEKELAHLRAELAERVVTHEIRVLDDNGKTRAALVVSNDGRKSGDAIPIPPRGSSGNAQGVPGLPYINAMIDTPGRKTYK